MKKVNRKDLRRLKTIKTMTDRLESAYQGLSEETQVFLREEFTRETSILLRHFKSNISECIEELLICTNENKEK